MFLYVGLFWLLSSVLGKVDGAGEGGKASGGPEILADDAVRVPVESPLKLVCQGDYPLHWRITLPVDNRFTFEYNTTILRTENSSSRPYTTTLLVSSVHSTDVGLYYCSYNESSSTLQDDSVYVFIDDENNPLVKAEESVLSAAVGQSFIIPCKPTSPQVNITITRNPDGQINLTESGYNPRVGLRMVMTLAIIGNYVDCQGQIGDVVQHNIWWLITSASAPVVFKPPHVNDPQDGTIQEGDNFTLDCSTSEEKHTYYSLNWTEPKRVIESGRVDISLFKIGPSDKKAFTIRITVYNARKEDSGQYVCQVWDVGSSKNVTHLIKVLGILGVSAAEDSLFGELCGPTKHCKSGAWLTCDDSQLTCQCRHHDQMIWNVNRSSCIVPLGKTCEWQYDVDRYEAASCEDDAYCQRSSHTCVCRSTHYQGNDGEGCVQKKDFESSCSSSDECRELKGLVCVSDSTCGCRNGQPSEDGTCTVPVGSRCSYEYKYICPTNSTCVADRPEEYFCKCNSGRYPDEEEANCLSVKPEGSTCSRDVECDPSKRLACSQGTCSCNPAIGISNTVPFNLVLPCHYDGRYHSDCDEFSIPKRTCLAKVGQPCTSSRYFGLKSAGAREDELYCTPNARCTGHPSVCECKEGLSRTKTGLCGADHGAPCTAMAPCIDGLVCDYDHSSGTGTCACPSQNHQVFDLEIKTCRSKGGASCYPGDNTTCIKHSTCIRNKHGRGVCECDTGYTERRGSGECDIEYNGFCSLETSTPACDQGAGLRCILDDDGVSACLCRNREDVYEPERKRCSRGVGYSCRSDEDCAMNAGCKADEDGNIYRCKSDLRWG